jgi:hypothetical protein
MEATVLNKMTCAAVWIILCINLFLLVYVFTSTLNVQSQRMLSEWHVNALGKLHCSWRQPGYDYFLDATIIECVSNQGEVYGRVRHARDESSWSSFSQGAYCGSGSGFVSEEAAMQCINRIYDTLPSGVIPTKQ